MLDVGRGVPLFGPGRDVLAEPHANLGEPSGEVQQHHEEADARAEEWRQLVARKKGWQPDDPQRPQQRPPTEPIPPITTMDTKTKESFTVKYCCW